MRLKKEVWYALIVLLLLPLLFWIFSDSEYDAFLKERNIPELLEARYYDSALVLIDSALTNPELSDLHPDLETKRREVLQEKLKNLYAPNFPLLERQIDSLEQRYDIYEAVNRINTALTAEVYSDAETEQLTARREELVELAARIEARDTITVLAPYTVQFGQTLNGIAYRFNMSPKALIRINNLRSTQIRQGQRLRVSVPVKVAEHKVKAGESLSGIAADYGMTLTEISRFNKLKSTDFIRVGQTLLIYQRVSARASEPKSEVQDSLAASPADSLQSGVE